ncbi:MAG: S8 family serine peptidase [Actinophytocola sp.]|nr:S8 family serine peptidase [Actinophytocola sp.]
MNIVRWRTALVLAVGGLAATALSAPVTAAAVPPGSTAGQTSSAERYSPDTVIVKYKSGASSKAQSAVEKLVGVLDSVAPILGTGAQTVRVKGDPKAAVERLNKSAAVEYAELNTIMTTQATPDDPRFDELYGLHNTGQGGGTADADIDAPEGWAAAGMDDFPATGGAKVGIVDTGIMKSHEEFQGDRIADCGGVNNFGLSLLIIIIGADPTIVDDPAKCEDDNGHGTHVAGTIAATANNGKGVAGVAFNSSLAVCKALNASGSGTLDMVANCITWLNEKGADVISMSLGGSSGSATLQSAVRKATENGSLLIAAAGNGGNSALNYPAAYPEVVSVAATDNNDEKASFSTFNEDVEVAAPGVDILSTWNDGGYRKASGTSMATPHAAGVAAVIASANRSGSVDAWRGELGSSVDDLGSAGRDVNFGFGRVNLLKATQ